MPSFTNRFAKGLDAIGIGDLLRPAVRCLREQRECVRRIPWLMSRGGKISTYLQNNACRKLHLGASDKTLPGWLNTDISPTSPNTVFLDATKSFPLPSQSFDFVFCEHFIEHISFTDGTFFLREVLKCLKVGGVFRVATPDLRRYVNLFSEQLAAEQKRFLEQSASMFKWDRVSPCVALNHLVYNWGHRFLYTREELEDALKRAGFTDVYDMRVGESSYDPLRDIEQHGKFSGEEMNRFETMVFEARKGQSDG